MRTAGRSLPSLPVVFYCAGERKIAELIDKNSPENLSEKDRLIFKKWLIDRWSIDYKQDYCKTDHWNVVKKETAIWSEGRCHYCGQNKEPKMYHHNHYCLNNPSLLQDGGLWRERYNDVFCSCLSCHLRHHDIWPDINCNYKNFGGQVILSEILGNISQIYGNRKSQKIRHLQFINTLIKDCSSPDKLCREGGRFYLELTVLNALSRKYDYANWIKYSLIFALISSVNIKNNDSMYDFIRNIDAEKARHEWECYLEKKNEQKSNS